MKRTCCSRNGDYKGLSFTDSHPDGEADPCTHVQLHHEVDVDKNTEQGQPGKQRDLEGDREKSA